MRWLIPILVLLLLGLQYRLWFGENSLAHKVELEEEVEQQRARNDRLRKRNRILAEEVEGLRNDPEAIEARARIDLGMIMEGETFFLVLDERHETSGPDPQAPSEPPEDEPREVVPEALFDDE